MMLLFGKKNQNQQEKEKEDDPYAGFGVEEVAAPLQTDDLEYDEGFQVQSVKSRHQYFRFFKKKVVNIAILELGPVSKESPGNSSYYRGVLKFLKPSVFEK